MGIHGLAKLIADQAPGAIKEQDIKNYFGRKIAIDASMCIYQFLIAVRQDGNVLQNEDGETTSHLMGMFYRTIRMLEHGIKPVYVFDGKPPQLKSAELEKRGERRAEAEKMLAQAQELGEQENIDKFTKRLVKVTKHHNDECKKLLTLMGVPYVEAPCEAEASCAALVKAGKVFATATEDMDGLTFGTNVLLRHVTASEAKKLPIQEFHFSRILEDIGLTNEQFIDLCILLGCDYCGTIKGIGPKRAIDLIKQHGCIEEILENIDSKKHPAPEDWLYKEARGLFLKAEVVDCSTVELKWSEPDEEGLVQFMCNEKQFSEDRMRNGCKKILKSRQGSTQGRLDSFFSITGSLSSKRKEPELKGSAKKKQKTGATPVEVPDLQHVCFSFLLCAYLVTSVMAVQSVRMVTANMLLSVFLVSGALAACKDDIDLFTTAPQKMKALTGSCLQIPCTFSTKSEEGFNSSRTTFGVWMKDAFDFNKPENVIFNSSRKSNIYPMTLTGDLSQRNCTTLFSNLLQIHTDVYFFRVENERFMSTASCDSVQITVRDSPPRPRIEISGDLKEKKSVSISCSASTPCPLSPPELTWNLQPDPHITIEENTDRTFTSKIQKTLVLSDEHDGFTISCSARYPVNEGKDVKTAEETKPLSVSYAPKDTSASISPSGPVSAGSWVNLTCSSRANPPVSRFTWFKNSSDGPVSVSEGDFYRFNATEGGVYYCVATNELGSQTSEILLTIEGVKQLPWVAVVGGIIVLICACVVIWWLKSKRSTSQQTRGPAALEPAVQEPARATETQTGDVHYGEIDFSKCRAERPSASVQDIGQQQDTLYAQVNVPKTVKRLPQTADRPEDLYAQVKRK